MCLIDSEATAVIMAGAELSRQEKLERFYDFSSQIELLNKYAISG